MKYLAITVGGETITGAGGIPEGGRSTLANIIQVGIEVAFIIAIIFCLLALIYGGLQWMTSGGDKQKLALAKQRLSYVIVGLIVVLLSFFIINLVLGFFNVGILNILGGGSAPGALPCDPRIRACPQ